MRFSLKDGHIHSLLAVSKQKFAEQQEQPTHH